LDKKVIREFWEANPVSSRVLPYEPGSPEYFEAHDRLRDQEGSPDTARWASELSEADGKQVLDVGCGSGYVTCQFAASGADVTSIDLTSAGVDLTNKRLQWRGLSARVLQADAENLPCDDESFDRVVSFGVIHHTPDTARAALEIHRVMRPGGRLLLMLYYRNSIANRLVFPLKRRIQPSWRGKSAQDLIDAADGVGNPLGKVYSKSEVKSLLPGFRDFEFRAASMNFRGTGLVPGPLRRAMERRWGWFLYIKANKI
jgi:SAM-dependent methyltransferase